MKGSIIFEFVRRKKVANIIVLLAVALVALIGVQLYWVQNAYTLREADFTSFLDKSSRLASPASVRL